MNGRHFSSRVILSRFWRAVCDDARLGKLFRAETSPVVRRLALVGMFLAVVSGCAGYQVGNAPLYRPDIQTVYVPMFQSSSLRPGLGERLTEAVIKEIELRTPYKVVGSPDKADSILTGRIVSETKRTVVENPYDDPREIATRFQVEVQWIDNRGRSLTAEETVPVPPELTSVVAEATFVPEVGQSLATAQQAAIQQLASQIVGMMENPW